MAAAVEPGRLRRGRKELDEGRGPGNRRPRPATMIGRGSGGCGGVGGHLTATRVTTARRGETEHAGPTYAALDLGTNNCRLLVARPTGDSFRVIDAFSRIIRLGEGVSTSRPHQRRRDLPGGRSARHLPRQDAQPRRDAREADRDRGLPRRDERRGISRSDRRGGRPRAGNHRSRDRGEAGGHRLHAADRSRRPTACSCSTSAAAPRRLVRLERSPPTRRGPPLPQIKAWVSLPVGVVTLAERHGGHLVTREIYAAMIAEVAASDRTLRRASMAAWARVRSICSARPAR